MKKPDDWWNQEPGKDDYDGEEEVFSLPLIVVVYIVIFVLIGGAFAIKYLWG